MNTNNIYIAYMPENASPFIAAEIVSNGCRTGHDGVFLKHDARGDIGQKLAPENLPEGLLENPPSIATFYPNGIYLPFDAPKGAPVGTPSAGHVILAVPDEGPRSKYNEHMWDKSTSIPVGENRLLPARKWIYEHLLRFEITPALQAV
jgi:hypothetical protein